MKTENVRRFPAQLRVVHRVWPLGKFVYLDRSAGGEYGWLKETRALLISGGKKGKILLAAFADHKPLRCTMATEQCTKVPSAMCPEEVVAAMALKKGITTDGCGLYVAVFPCHWCTLFFARTGITNLYYSRARELDGPPQHMISKFEANNIEVIHVDVQ